MLREKFRIHSPKKINRLKISKFVKVVTKKVIEVNFRGKIERQQNVRAYLADIEYLLFIYINTIVFCFLFSELRCNYDELPGSVCGNHKGETSV